jgi:hypothetical protein
MDSGHVVVPAYPNANLTVMFIVPILSVNASTTLIAEKTCQRKVNTMSEMIRVETSRTACECGRGEFVFYACEADRWLYVDNPHEKWFEMHIFCESCAFLFRRYQLTLFSAEDEAAHWKIVISEPDRVPSH